MKVLGIYGSPRPEGNSDLLLDHALQAAAAAGAEVERIYVRDLTLHGCRECGGCDATGKCVQEDEMQKVYPRLQAAGAIIVATPIFFYAMPSQLKALVDRAQAPWNFRRLSKTADRKKLHESGHGYLLALGATRGRNLFEGVQLTARYFFDALDKSYAGGLFLRGVETKGEVKDRPGFLDQAAALGKAAAAGAGFEWYGGG